MSDTTKYQATCDGCGATHPAEYSHEGQFGEGAIYAVVCTVDWLTSYHTSEGVSEVPTVHGWDAIGEVATGTVACKCGWVPSAKVAPRNQRRAVSIHATAARKAQH